MKHDATEAEKKAVLDAVFTPLDGSIEAKMRALELRVTELEKHSHTPVNLRPAVEEIVKELIS